MLLSLSGGYLLTGFLPSGIFQVH